MDIMVRGSCVITSASEGEAGIINNGAVCISGGRIADIGSFTEMKNKYPNIPVTGDGTQLLMPGIIDGHSHGNGLTSIQRGMTFDFLENLLIDWAWLPGVDLELDAALSAVRHLRGGCTTMHLNYWGEEPNQFENAQKAIEACRRTGIRLAYSPGGRNVNALALDDEDFYDTLPQDLQEFVRPLVYFDKKEFVQQYLTLFDALHSRYNGEQVRIILGPSWAQGCTDDFLRAVKEKADSMGKVQIHLHTLQTPLQKAYGIRKYGKSLLGHLDDLGLVDENLTLGHAVFVSDGDIEILAEKGASITHHPSCNLAVRNGIAPVYAMLKVGVNVALGIDDKGINDDEDAIMELRLIHRLHRVSGFDLARTTPLSAFDVLKIGTTAGARVCGYGGEVGELKKGMRADMILLDLEEVMEDPCMLPGLNKAEIFIHRAKGAHVNTVLVDGKIVMENRKMKLIDVDALYREIKEAVFVQGGEGTRGNQQYIEEQSNSGQDVQEQDVRRTVISPEQRRFAEQLQRIKPYYHKWYEGWENLDYRPFYVMNSRV